MLTLPSAALIDAFIAGVQREAERDRERQREAEREAGRQSETERDRERQRDVLFEETAIDWLVHAKLDADVAIQNFNAHRDHNAQRERGAGGAGGVVAI